MGHLKDIQKGYFSHLFGAWKMAAIFIFGALRCIVHGLLPNFDTECAQETAGRVTADIPESLS